MTGDSGQNRERATERGERLRARLLELLREGGPQHAAELIPQMDRDVFLSEVAFQLERLAEEGKATGEQGGVYRAL